MPKATAPGNDIVVISEYYDGNISNIVYPLGLKLCGFGIKDVNCFADQMEHYLEVENINYEKYDTTKRSLLLSVGLFLLRLL